MSGSTNGTGGLAGWVTAALRATGAAGSVAGLIVLSAGVTGCEPRVPGPREHSYPATSAGGISGTATGNAILAKYTPPAASAAPAGTPATTPGTGTPVTPGTGTPGTPGTGTPDMTGMAGTPATPDATGGVKPRDRGVAFTNGADAKLKAFSAPVADHWKLGSVFGSVIADAGELPQVKALGDTATGTFAYVFAKLNPAAKVDAKTIEELTESLKDAVMRLKAEGNNADFSELQTLFFGGESLNDTNSFYRVLAGLKTREEPVLPGLTPETFRKAANEVVRICLSNPSAATAAGIGSIVPTELTGATPGAN